MSQASNHQPAFESTAPSDAPADHDAATSEAQHPIFIGKGVRELEMVRIPSFFDTAEDDEEHFPPFVPPEFSIPPDKERGLPEIPKATATEFRPDIFVRETRGASCEETVDVSPQSDFFPENVASVDASPVAGSPDKGHAEALCKTRETPSVLLPQTIPVRVESMPLETLLRRHRAVEGICGRYMPGKKGVAIFQEPVLLTPKIENFVHDTTTNGRSEPDWHGLLQPATAVLVGGPCRPGKSETEKTGPDRADSPVLPTVSPRDISRKGNVAAPISRSIHVGNIVLFNEGRQQNLDGVLNVRGQKISVVDAATHSPPNAKIEESRDVMLSELLAQTAIPLRLVPTVTKIPEPEPLVVAKNPEPEPVVVTETPEPKPLVIAETQEPEPLVVTETTKPEPVVVTETTKPEPVVVTETPKPEPLVVAETPEPEPVVVAETPEPKPLVVTETPEPEPLVVAENPEPEVPEPKPPYPNIYFLSVNSPEFVDELHRQAMSQFRRLGRLLAREAGIVAFSGYTRRAGTTTLLLGAARELARLDKQVLLIDLNFENPELLELFGLTAERGWEEWLAPEVIDACAGTPPLIRLDPEGVFVLPLCRQAIEEARYFLDHYDLSAVIGHFLTWFDHILIDGGALEELRLAETIDSLNRFGAESLLLVLNTKNEPTTDFYEAVERLDWPRPDLLGIAENCTPNAA